MRTFIRTADFRQLLLINEINFPRFTQGFSCPFSRPDLLSFAKHRYESLEDRDYETINPHPGNESTLPSATLRNTQPLVCLKLLEKIR
ncbi:MAG: hypothetical protein ACLS35_06495 [Odoribacter splanchnicus]